MPTTKEKLVYNLSDDPHADLVFVESHRTADKKGAYYRRCCNFYMEGPSNFCTGPIGHTGDHTFSYDESWNVSTGFGVLVWSIKAFRGPEADQKGAFFRRACNATFWSDKYTAYFCTLAKGHDGPHQATNVGIVDEGVAK